MRKILVTGGTVFVNKSRYYENYNIHGNKQRWHYKMTYVL